MSQAYPYPPAPEKKSNTLLIVLGVLGGGVLLSALVCCGGVAWIAQPPRASAAAKQPFEFATVPMPNFNSGGEQELLGVPVKEIHLKFGVAGGPSGKLWVYLPKKDSPPKSLPCVLIAGAGSTLMEGMTLGDGDRDEHFPYVQEGFAVVAYDLDGGDQGGETERYAAFTESRAGLVNARNALEYVLTHLPEVDPKRIFAAGHSSAASHALLFAEHEPRLAGVAAYAPCVNIPERMPGLAVRVLETQMPGLTDFLTQSSPHTHEARLNCPVFLFGAADDDNTKLADTQAFATRLKSLGKDVTLETVPEGGHYDSMIEEGIPRGIAWMKSKGK